MPIAVTPLSPAIGAAVTGIDLSGPLDDTDFAAILDAFLAHSVLVFPAQAIDAEDQLRFSARFGRLGRRKRRIARPEADDVPDGVMLISNIRKDGVPIGSLPDGEMMFHSDGAYAEEPYLATFLHAVEIPSHGGDTLFASLHAAAEALPAAQRRRIEGRRAVHRYYAGTTDRNSPAASLSGEASQPVLRIHEQNGRETLFVSRLMTHRIEGMEPADSDALLEELFDHVERPEFIYRHRWTPGDLVMWDNRGCNHARTDFPGGERRLLRRTTVESMDGASPREKRPAGPATA
jgi:taurine dioxygenase